MKNIMLDLETLGNKSNAAIVAIGAVYFDLKTGELGEEFKVIVDAESCTDYGLTMDASTIEWWMRQSREARNIFSDENKLSLPIALAKFKKFINNGDVQIWGKGAGFDNVIMAHAYRVCHMKLPWNYWNDRDVRTIFDLGCQIGINKNDFNFGGTRHDCLDDAKHQAKIVITILQKLLKRD